MHAVKHAQILHVEKKGRTCNNGSVIDHLQQWPVNLTIIWPTIAGIAIQVIIHPDCPVLNWQPMRARVLAELERWSRDPRSRVQFPDLVVTCRNLSRLGLKMYIILTLEFTLF